MQPLIVVGQCPMLASHAEEVAWETQATRHHVHFGLKSAPSHRNFRPERKESAN
jgi:hypothetical protein